MVFPNGVFNFSYKESQKEGPNMVIGFAGEMPYLPIQTASPNSSHTPPGSWET
jgi:hypothetical protein